MSDSLRVTLVVWRDASTDPPPRDHDVWTDVGEAYCWGRNPVWEWTKPGMEADCTPTVWCDPTPPGENAVTLDDLRAAARACAVLAESIRAFPEDATPDEIIAAGMHHVDAGTADEWDALAARLRAALDAVNAEKEEA